MCETRSCRLCDHYRVTYTDRCAYTESVMPAEHILSDSYGQVLHRRNRSGVTDDGYYFVFALLKIRDIGGRPYVTVKRRFGAIEGGGSERHARRPPASCKSLLGTRGRREGGGFHTLKYAPITGYVVTHAEER